MTARISTIPSDRYHADDVGADGPTLSSSVLRTLIEKTPRHAKNEHPKLADDRQSKESAAMSLGTAVHAMLLQGRDVAVAIAHDSFRTKAARDERDAARSYGMVPLKMSEYQRAVAIHDAVRAQIATKLAGPPLLVNGAAEQTIVWEDRGVLCRALIDWLSDDMEVIDDLKTEGRTANPVDWERTMFDDDRLYHVQAQMYRRAVHALTGRWPAFRFVVVESHPPYAVSVIAPGKRAFELADEQIDWALDTWAACLQTGTWPAYTDQVAYIDPPAWAEARWTDRQFIQEAA